MKRKLVKAAAILCVSVLALSGCGNNEAALEKAEIKQLEKDLAALTEHIRPAGSDGEAAAVQYLRERFEGMGYTVMLQEYTAINNVAANNVIAVRGAEDTSDILVISAHHDTVTTSFGANDNGSGVAALLMIAERLSEVDTDTELRFISFTDEENGKNGSRQYVERLPIEERNRIVGCIQLDMLGGLGSNGIMFCTTDGSPNWLTDLLLAGDDTILPGKETASDHAIFQLAGIPSVLITQEDRGYLYHTMGDTVDQLDVDVIRTAASMVADVTEQIASADTTSYQALAHEEANNYFYAHDRQSRIFYSATRAENEAYLGFTGQLIDQWEDSGEFWSDTYEVYQYQMGWFGGETPMNTHYIYRNDYLDKVEIHPSENGYTTEQLCTLITNTHGPTKKADESERSWDWEDTIYSKYISLYEADGKPVVNVYSYSLGLGTVLGSYDVVNGEAVIDDPQHQKVWELLCSVLPLEHRQKIAQFQLYTDGYSNILAYTSPVEREGHTRNNEFSISVDYYDVYDEYGNARDWSKLMYTLIHEYGHVLLEDDTQIDLAVGSDIHDPVGFIEGSFRQRYYDTFWQDPYSSYLGSYWEVPENYVSQYAGNMFHEDIADTFAVFVFADKPKGDGVAGQKLLFFWDDKDMVALRDDIRAGLGLE